MEPRNRQIPTSPASEQTRAESAFTITDRSTTIPKVEATSRLLRLDSTSQLTLAQDFISPVVSTPGARPPKGGLCLSPSRSLVEFKLVPAA